MSGVTVHKQNGIDGLRVDVGRLEAGSSPPRSPSPTSPLQAPAMWRVRMPVLSMIHWSVVSMRSFQILVGEQSGRCVRSYRRDFCAVQAASPTEISETRIQYGKFIGGCKSRARFCSNR